MKEADMTQQPAFREKQTARPITPRAPLNAHYRVQTIKYDTILDGILTCARKPI